MDIRRAKTPTPNQTFNSHTTYNYVSQNYLHITSQEKVMIMAIDYNNRPNYPAVAIWFINHQTIFNIFNYFEP